MTKFKITVRITDSTTEITIDAMQPIGSTKSCFAPVALSRPRVPGVS